MELPTHEGEVWKDIPGYEGFYQASSMGRVKSLCRKSKTRSIRIVKERFLKFYKNKRGYWCVTLNKFSTSKNYRVHQLVAMAFLNHKPCGLALVVDHVDLNKTNNKLENLEIVTSLENTRRYIAYAKRNGIKLGPRGGHKTQNNIGGVYWRKDRNKWYVMLGGRLNRSFHGHFSKKEDAIKKYKSILNKKQ